MTIYDNVFPLGIGTNRFEIQGVDDHAGIERSAEIVISALEAGASYIDIAGTYSKGMAETVCKLALSHTHRHCDITVKSSFLFDRSQDEALRRVETVFSNLGIDHASYFVIWNIASYQQFMEIMRKGSLYDGAIKAKENGLIDHICFSTHASPSDIIKILETGAFEGVTVSFSALNAAIMQPVLDFAFKKDVGVVVMNPLGGGVIPQNKDFFQFLCGTDDKDSVQAALRYAYAHPAVKVILSGMSSYPQLLENIETFRQTCIEKPKDRIARVDRNLRKIGIFCTGCRYCDGCPQEIPVFELMQAYNTLFFPSSPKMYNRTEPRVLENIGICSRLKNTFGYLPSDAVNPCVKCRMCEKKCTAHLPIIERIEELYVRFQEASFSKKALLDRLKYLIGDRRRIAFYPGGGYTAYVLGLLKEAYPDIKFEISLFDTNPAVWGSSIGEYIVKNPEEILAVNPELIIVSNYNYSEEIYSSLLERLQDQIPVVKLHLPEDVPWMF